MKEKDGKDNLLFCPPDVTTFSQTVRGVYYKIVQIVFFNLESLARHDSPLKDTNMSNMNRTYNVHERSSNHYVDDLEPLEISGSDTCKYLIFTQNLFDLFIIKYSIVEFNICTIRSYKKKRNTI